MLRGFLKSALLAAMFLTSVSLYGQGSAGRISGTVTDQSGGAIPAGKVTVTDVGRGVARTLTTDAAGAYAAPNLTPGTYTVHVEFMGFRNVDRKDVLLEVGQDIRIDVTMQPGDQTQTVTVTGEAATINTTSAELGGALQNEVINDLPLNGRNFENLLNLRPGVAVYAGGGGWTQSTNGLRPHDNFYMVDGINSNDPWMAQSVMNAGMAAGDAGTMLPIDAIDEFKTNQNPRAEYGWKPGAVVNVGIKSGANSFHGTAYAYGRTDSWDANNFFSNAAGAPIAPLRLEQFGGSVGGRIIKDKLFFFGNFESQQYTVGAATTHKVPITAAGVGSNPAQNLIGACQQDLAAGTLRALSAQLAGLSMTCSPLANYPGLFPVNSGANGLTIATALANQNTIYSGVGKLDYHLNEKHSFNGLYFQSPGNGTFVDAPTTQVNQQWLTNQYAKSQVLSGNWLWIVNSNTVNSFRVGYSRYHQIFNSADGTDNPESYKFNGSTYNINTGQTNPLYFGLPAISFQGGYNMTLGASWPKTVGPNQVDQFTESISIQKGNHSLKFGGEFLINKSDNDVTANTKGPVRFADIPSFFSGTMNQARITTGNLARSMQDEGVAFFAQDDWRVTPRLTINAGIRYELTTVISEANNLLGNFIPGQGILQVGTSKLGSVFHGDHNNFAPRLGFAWDINGNGKTVLRGGAGIYFEQGSFDALNAIGNLNGLRFEPTGVNLYSNGSLTPTTAGGNINVTTLTFTGAALGSATTPGTPKYGWANNGPNTSIYSLTPACGDGTVTLASGLKPAQCTLLGVDPNLRTPYVATYNMGIQRAITNSLSIEVSYVGNHATKLLGLSDLNQALQVGGYSPGWGNPNTPGTAAFNCLASAPTYTNCAPNSAAITAARPFATQFPYLSYIYYLSNSNSSSYNGLQTSVTQRTSHGLSYVLGYTWSHSLAESNDNWSFILPINSLNQKQLYSSTGFDIHNRFTASVTYALPGIKSPAQLLQGWSLNSILTLQSAAPWGVHDVTTDFSGTAEIAGQNTNGEQWNFYGNPNDFNSTKALLNTNGGNTGIPYFAGTSNPACLAKAQANGPLAVASLTNLGCYAMGKSILIPPAYGSYGTVGPNIFRGFPFYNLDLSITKQFRYKERLTAQFRVEAFNLLNHVNISNVQGGPGGDGSYSDPSGLAGVGFGFRPQTPDLTSSNPVLGSGGPRAIQMGLKLIF